MTQTKYFDPWLQQVVDECSDENAGLDLLKIWHATLETDVQFISSDDKAPFTDEEINQYIEVLNIIEDFIKERVNKDSASKTAELVGGSSDDVNQVVEQVQLLLDNGYGFSDACDIVSILTPLKTRFKNFEDSKAMAEFWDYVSLQCEG